MHDRARDFRPALRALSHCGARLTRVWRKAKQSVACTTVDVCADVQFVDPHGAKVYVADITYDSSESMRSAALGVLLALSVLGTLCCGLVEFRGKVSGWPTCCARCDVVEHCHDVKEEEAACGMKWETTLRTWTCSLGENGDDECGLLIVCDWLISLGLDCSDC